MTARTFFVAVAPKPVLVTRRVPLDVTSDATLIAWCACPDDRTLTEFATMEWSAGSKLVPPPPPPPRGKRGDVPPPEYLRD